MACRSIRGQGPRTRAHLEVQRQARGRVGAWLTLAHHPATSAPTAPVPAPHLRTGGVGLRAPPPHPLLSWQWQGSGPPAAAARALVPAQPRCAGCATKADQGRSEQASKMVRPHAAPMLQHGTMEHEPEMPGVIHAVALSIPTVRRAPGLQQAHTAAAGLPQRLGIQRQQSTQAGE